LSLSCAGCGREPTRPVRQAWAAPDMAEGRPGPGDRPPRRRNRGGRRGGSVSVESRCRASSPQTGRRPRPLLLDPADLLPQARLHPAQGARHRPRRRLSIACGADGKGGRPPPSTACSTTGTAPGSASRRTADRGQGRHGRLAVPDLQGLQRLERAGLGPHRPTTKTPWTWCADIRGKSGQRIGDKMITAITPAAADKLYARSATPRSARARRAAAHRREGRRGLPARLEGGAPAAPRAVHPGPRSATSRSGIPGKASRCGGAARRPSRRRPGMRSTPSPGAP
jgi:hypothetical protein